jgi:hypothetical protein
VDLISSSLISLHDRKCLCVRQILEAVETVIIAGDDLDYGEAGSGDEDDEDGGASEQQVLVVGDIHLKEEEEEEMVEGLQEMLEEQVVLEEGVQYEIELA